MYRVFVGCQLRSECVCVCAVYTTHAWKLAHWLVLLTLPLSAVAAVLRFVFGRNVAIDSCCGEVSTHTRAYTTLHPLSSIDGTFNIECILQRLHIYIIYAKLWWCASSSNLCYIIHADGPSCLPLRWKAQVAMNRNAPSQAAWMNGWHWEGHQSWRTICNIEKELVHPYIITYSSIIACDVCTWSARSRSIGSTWAHGYLDLDDIAKRVFSVFAKSAA